MDKIAICIPTHTSISALLFDQWIGLSAWCANNNIPLITIANRTHNDARNWLATGGGGFIQPQIMLGMFDTFIWIDSDMSFGIHQIETLLEHTHPFVSGVYYKTDELGKNKTVMAARWDEEKFIRTGVMDFIKPDEIQKSKKLIPISYCGFGFCKTDTLLFKKMAYPYFTNKRITISKEDRSYSEYASEDTSFCLDSPVKPMLDPNIILGHVKEYII